MQCAENENMIQAVAPKRSDQAFSIWVLPRRSRGYWSVTDTHRPNQQIEGHPLEFRWALQLSGARLDIEDAVFFFGENSDPCLRWYPDSILARNPAVAREFSHDMRKCDFQEKA
jgi:hypothetical protein